MESISELALGDDTGILNLSAVQYNGKAKLIQITALLVNCIICQAYYTPQQLIYTHAHIHAHMVVISHTNYTPHAQQANSPAVTPGWARQHFVIFFRFTLSSSDLSSFFFIFLI